MQAEQEVLRASVHYQQPRKQGIQVEDIKSKKQLLKHESHWLFAFVQVLQEGEHGVHVFGVTAVFRKYEPRQERQLKGELAQVRHS